ncbi:MAG TPA: bifunctional demethylmenaquinone methyltransferase/2-methoxy-6-polyprenyl-1,4-benzoquinol methylase UbiE [Bacteroidota bacterium]|nr:bifunctional demethylmenaquinone methyltransferase/2-methoxy-6-polyprenyl-1,4-benzoquinol methylase UbiE [Bacteroidota bacterium]
MTRPSLVATFLMRNEPERKIYDRGYVRSLFDSIAFRYDFLNHALSAGLDVLWRKRAIGFLQPFHPQHILDVATGTADLAVESARTLGSIVVGVDLSQEMLRIGRSKIESMGLSSRITLIEGTAEELTFADKSFDAVTAAFGVRNFTDLRQGLAEMYRVLKTGGAAVILEFSRPSNRIVDKFFGFYFKHVLPVVGGFISGNAEAYRYLPKTVGEFPAGLDFLSILHKVGFNETIQYPLTLGIATIYIGIKR